MDIYSGYRFGFSTCSTSIRTAIYELTQCPIYCHISLHSISSEQGTHFMQTKEWQWTDAHGIYWLYLIIQHPETAGLIELLKGLLKIQSQC